MSDSQNSNFLRAGAARRDISPRKPMFLVGYPHVPRTSTGIHDPLFASALFLTDGRTPILFISVDILCISFASANQCRAAIAKESGVPVENILISATHTHSGPVTFELLAWSADPIVPPPDPEYMDLFHKGIIEAGVGAVRTARSAELGVTSAPISGVGCNRLSPDGPFDPEAGILVVSVNGKPLAVNIVYGMHPTVLHEDSTLVSSDFPHFAREVVEKAFPGVIPVYHTAPCGNLSPRYHVRGQTFAEAERLGKTLGIAIVDAIGKLRREEYSSLPRLGAFKDLAELIPNKFPSVEQAHAALAEARQNFERLKREGAPHGPVRTAECTVFGREEGVVFAEAQADGRTAAIQEKFKRAEVQVFQVGPTLIAGFPGELFVEYSLELKKKTPGRLFNISLANGELQGYIVTPGSTGYEASFSMFAPESGRRITDTALGLIRKAMA